MKTLIVICITIYACLWIPVFFMQAEADRIEAENDAQFQETMRIMDRDIAQKKKLIEILDKMYQQ